MRLLAALIVLIPVIAQARANGLSGYSGKNMGTFCTSCHSGGTAPTVTVQGPSQLAVGQTSTFTVTITGGAASTAGVGAALGGAGSTGASLLSGADTKVVNAEVTHAQAALFAGGQATFTFRVQAPPTTGTMTLYVAGLSGNGGGTDTGDGAARTTLSLSVVASLPAGDAGTGGGAGGGTGGGGGGSGGGGSGGGGAAADGGSAPAPAPTPTPTAGPAPASRPAGVLGGTVEGDVGCSAVGGLPVGLLASATALLSLRRRRARTAR